MLRLSSNLTLFLKLFIPVFGTTLMVALAIAVWTSPEHYFADTSLTSLRYGVLFMLVMGVGTFLLLLWPLKRVETDGTYLYVSDYFRTARYHLGRDVAGFTEGGALGLTVATAELSGKGTFGRSIRFLATRKPYLEFVNAYRYERTAHSEAGVDDVVE